MAAQEARNSAKKTFGDQYESIIESETLRIFKAIQDVSSQGKFDLYLYNETLNKDIIRKLEEKGFKVNVISNFQFETNLTRISW